MKKIVSFEEAKNITATVINLAAPAAPMVKVPMDNVVFDKLGEIPLLEMLMNLTVVTKEHIEGTTYDKKNFQMVMRIIDGKLLMRGQDQFGTAGIGGEVGVRHCRAGCARPHRLRGHARRAEGCLRRAAQPL